MAEALISVLLEQLASITYQHVEEEVSLVLNAEEDVAKFAGNLEVISAVLEDAELRQVKDAGVRNWLEKLKDVSYKMDNVLDEWNTEILKQQVEKQEEHGGSTSLVTKKKMKAISRCHQLKTLPDFLRKTPLKTLDITDCGSLAQGCQKGRGKEWPKISHIPNIRIKSEYSDSDSDDEGDGIVEAEDDVELQERPSTSDLQLCDLATSS